MHEQDGEANRAGLRRALVGPPGRGLLIIATTSVEAGKRDLGRTKVNFARSRADRRLIKKNDMSSAGQNEGRPIWVGLISI